MFLRVIAFTVGLIAVVAGLQSYNSELSTAPVPILTGGLVMFLAAFNLLPQFKQCDNCGKKIPMKAHTCRFCGKKQKQNHS